MEQACFANEKVGDLVAADYRLATVFKKYGIDFCCGGGKTLKAASEAKGIDLEVIEKELASAITQRDTSGLSDAARWSLDFLADYIVNVHHRYIRETIPVLREFTRRVAMVHGMGNPEVVEIARLFEELSVELEDHIAEEEQVLFPYIKELVAAEKNGSPVASPDFGSADNPIGAMEHDHDRAGELMHQIRDLSGNYTPPEHACNTYRVSFAKLEEFEDDLHRHVHLENNILFPRAITLEKRLAA